MLQSYRYKRSSAPQERRLWLTTQNIRPNSILLHQGAGMLEGHLWPTPKNCHAPQKRGYVQRYVWPNFILLRHVTGVQDVSTPAGLKDHLFCRSEGAVIIVWSDGAGLPRGGVCRKRRVCPQGSHPGAPLKRQRLCSKTLCVAKKLQPPMSFANKTRAVVHRICFTL